MVTRKDTGRKGRVFLASSSGEISIAETKILVKEDVLKTTVACRTFIANDSGQVKVEPSKRQMILSAKREEYHEYTGEYVK
jgi:hypothetical protein